MSSISTFNLVAWLWCCNKNYRIGAKRSGCCDNGKTSADAIYRVRQCCKSDLLLFHLAPAHTLDVMWARRHAQNGGQFKRSSHKSGRGYFRSALTHTLGWAMARWGWRRYSAGMKSHDQSWLCDWCCWLWLAVVSYRLGCKCRSSTMRTAGHWPTAGVSHCSRAVGCVAELVACLAVNCKCVLVSVCARVCE